MSSRAVIYSTVYLEDSADLVNWFAAKPWTVFLDSGHPRSKQGRYDIICPIETAYKLHQAWPEADYTVVADGGHSALDPSIRSRLIEATEHFKNIKI